MHTRRSALKNLAALGTGVLVSGLSNRALGGPIGDAVSRFKSFFVDCNYVSRWGQFAWVHLWDDVSSVCSSGSSSTTADFFYSNCTYLLNAGKLREIKPWAEKNCKGGESLRDGLITICKDKCGFFAGYVASHINRNGGMKGTKDKSAPNILVSKAYTISETQDPPWYELVRYDPASLEKYVNDMKRALDGGYMVQAGVYSGAIKSATRPLSNPEHYLLIVGYEEEILADKTAVHFVAWDPDSAVSFRPEPAFCTITHYIPDDKDSRYHRLGTSRNDEELKCVSGNGKDQGKFKASDGGALNKRYQITKLQRV